MSPRGTSILVHTVSLLWWAGFTNARKHHMQPTGWLANIIWIHIFLQILVWGFLFPMGMILGITRSRWHIPLQSAGIALTMCGYVLGFFEEYMHEARYRLFNTRPHRVNAKVLFAAIITQLFLGVYLKLRLHEGRAREWTLRLHGTLGRLFPILGWTQCLCGVIATFSYCRGDSNLNYCLTYYGMGTGFLAYSVVIAVMVVVGQDWLRRRGQSLEMWDSLAIFLSGSVVLVRGISGRTAHRIVLGCIWSGGGLLGLVLSRNARRTIVPAAVLIATGWAFASNSETFEIDNRVYAMLGYTLIAAGIARMVEIVFIVPNGSAATDQASDFAAKPTNSSPGNFVSRNAFLHITPFMLTCAGMLSISGTVEELRLMFLIQMEPSTYILIMFCLALIVYVVIIAFLWLYSAADKAQLDSHHGDAPSFESAMIAAPQGYSLVADDAEQRVIGDED